MLRLFVAIPLPEEVRDRLAGFYRGIPGARWVDPGNVHLTLRFIGDVNEDTAEDIDDCLAAISMPAFELTLAGVDFFGKLHKARAVYAGVERSQPLRILYDKVEGALARAGIGKEERKFTPHVTLARIKGETGHHLTNFLAEHNLERIGPFAVTEFVLFRSHLSSDGAIHERLVEYPLTSVERMAAR